MTQQHEHLTRAEFHAYLDGQLPSEKTEPARRHLSRCQRCSETFEGLRQLDSAVRSLPLERVSGSFTEKVMAQVGLSKVDSGVFRFIVYLPSVVGLVLVLGVMGGVYLLAGGAGVAVEPTGVGQTASTLVQTLGTAMKELVGWVASVGSAGALAISAFALGLILLVALGELLTVNPIRKGRGRLRNSASA